MPIDRIAIFGTGLIGASVGLALRSSGYAGSIVGWDPNHDEAVIAEATGAITVIASDPLKAARESQLILLSGPVFTILEWLDRLAPVLQSGQLVTDVGSVKGVICQRAQSRYDLVHTAGFLPGHPMAGKEVSGAVSADANLFDGAAWLFTETAGTRSMHPASRKLAEEWREWTKKFGCRVIDIDPARHDVLCAWVSHLPQYLSTALSALLEDQFPEKDDMLAVGGRALREMTRLGGSPLSMWRDVAHTNTAAISDALFALEQRLAHLRENLKTPELRDEFERANRFRASMGPTKK